MQITIPFTMLYTTYTMGDKQIWYRFKVELLNSPDYPECQRFKISGGDRYIIAERRNQNRRWVWDTIERTTIRHTGNPKMLAVQSNAELLYTHIYKAIDQYFNGEKHWKWRVISQ